MTRLTVFGRMFRIWYDRGEQMWTVVEVDGAENQLGGSQAAPTREMAFVYVGIIASGPA